ncbi:MAG: hypothetical protein A3G34_11650 [Candidatus Lindowbacteria bacterium RIFCSPLOWO2_12_FULL_62_27]|nr:MAG: hypothetical protein A3G34_11650 [Candidatus Lindowbacteria bacterium RIFCSPLOWO2_12_FULL_62_27]
MSRWSKVVILGHTGFIGRALARHCERAAGMRVFGYSSDTVDLRRPESMDRLADVVDSETALFLASAVTREKGDTKESFDDNAHMVHTVARFLETHRPGKCVYFSSIAVYGDSRTDLAITEETRVNPDSFYALAKYAGEYILGWACRAAGVPYLNLRVCHVYGPGDTHATYGPMQFVSTLLAERAIRLFGRGEDRRDHLYIDDLIGLTDRLTFGDAEGLFNLVSGTSVTRAQIVDMIREIAPHEFELKFIPRKKPHVDQQFDISKLLRAAPGFGFTPLEEGLKQTLDAFTADSRAR